MDKTDPQIEVFLKFDPATRKPLPVPEKEHVDVDVFKRVMATHRWRELQELKHQKRLDDIKNGELFPDDVSNAKADRGTHADPVANAIIQRLNGETPPKTQRYKLTDGHCKLTLDHVLQLKAAAVGDGRISDLTCEQVTGFLGIETFPNKPANAIAFRVGQLVGGRNK